MHTNDQGSQTAKDKTDTKVVDIPMTENLAGANYNSLDQDDSKVDLDAANGQVSRFKNLNGYNNVNNPDVFIGDTEPDYFLAPGGQSCEQACRYKGQTCDASLLKDAAVSLDKCKDIIKSLGKNPQTGGEYPDDNSGCTYHPAQPGWYQVMRENWDGDPGCSIVNPDINRQRVCSCHEQALPPPPPPAPAPPRRRGSQWPGSRKRRATHF